MSEHKVTRRRFLKGLAAVAGGTVLAACAPQVVKETVVVEKVVEKAVLQTVVVEKAVEQRVVETVVVTQERIVEKQAAVEPVELRMGHWVGNLITPIMPIIEDKYNVKMVEESTSYGEYQTKTLTQLVGGVAPDLLYMEGMPSPWYTDGFCLPLDAALASSDVDHSKWAVRYPEDLYFRGKVYGMPMFTAFGVGYGINLGLIEEQGFDVPHPWPFFGTDEFDRFSWDDLAENFEACTRRSSDGEIEIWGDGSGYHSWGMWSQLAVYENGGMIFNSEDADETECLINSDENYEAIKRYFDTVGDVSPEMGASQAYPEGLWRSKVCVSQLSWYGCINCWRHRDDLGFDYDTIWMPHFDKQRTIMTAANVVGANASSDHAHLTSDICVFMSSDFDFQNALFKVWLNLPPHDLHRHLETVEDEWSLSHMKGSLARYEAFSECDWCTEGFEMRPWHLGKNPNYFRQTFTSEYQSALAGEKTLREALDTVKSMADAELAKL